MAYQPVPFKSVKKNSKLKQLDLLFENKKLEKTENKVEQIKLKWSFGVFIQIDLILIRRKSLCNSS